MKTKYKFQPMLGPASNYPEGSVQWALCLGNELDYNAERVDRDLDDLIGILQRVTSAAIPPWEVWPPSDPGGIDNYMMLCTGYTYFQLYSLIDLFRPNHGLPVPSEPVSPVAVALHDALVAAAQIHPLNSVIGPEHVHAALLKMLSQK